MHVYKQPGYYTATLKVTDGKQSLKQQKMYSYQKMIMRSLIIRKRRQNKNHPRLRREKKFISLFLTHGSSTEFISEEILQKINEDTQALTKAKQIVIWTEENAGLNALSRFIQSNTKTWKKFFSKDNYYIGE